jgi:drug/metabolite transporter (DMT)-like permease
MRLGDYARLLLLAAIWGAHYGFVRVAAPAFGPLWTAEGRLLIGAAVLLAWFGVRQLDFSRAHLPFHAWMGLLNTALPFALLAYAATVLPASILAVVNGTAPMMVLVLGAAFGIERLTLGRIIGMLLGFAGVWLLSDPQGIETSAAQGDVPLALAAVLGTNFFYALSAVLAKRYGEGIPSKGMALGMQVWGALYLAPLVAFAPVPDPAPGAVAWANLLALGLLASGVAFVLYFRLVKDVGPARAQSVSFAVPLFGMLWGMLFLGERMGAQALAGALCIVAGVVLVTMSRPSRG